MKFTTYYLILCLLWGLWGARCHYKEIIRPRKLDMLRYVIYSPVLLPFYTFYWIKLRLGIKDKVSAKFSKWKYSELFNLLDADFYFYPGSRRYNAYLTMVRHFYFAKGWLLNPNIGGSLAEYVVDSFHNIMWRFPLNKYATIVGQNFVHKDNTKMLSITVSREYDSSYYYSYTSYFGYLKITRTQYVDSNNESHNLFLSVINSISNNEVDYKLTTKKEFLYKGWIFTKKKAIEVLTQLRTFSHPYDFTVLENMCKELNYIYDFFVNKTPIPAECFISYSGGYKKFLQEYIPMWLENKNINVISKANLIGLQKLIEQRQTPTVKKEEVAYIKNILNYEKNNFDFELMLEHAFLGRKR